MKRKGESNSAGATSQGVMTAGLASRRPTETSEQPESAGLLRPEAAELYARFFKVLSDPTRLRLLALLLEAPVEGRTVSELVAVLGVPQGRVSTHLGCLRWCGLVQGVREGKYVYYRLSDERVRLLLTLAGTLLQEHAASIASCGVIR
ncbi:ArsR/SmtB family transcription factor [Thermogemmatispora carboxidivorans]|uniref:ArsR/SmtB family transcription factor n=1 Tax=Thermogemmatispora carboxidivorans TaxID=1382306 RepID=UPI00192E3061|nr:metalloregulator ArsR/SmtB family transcription factor [Thermogemmatispora carboxidivorans]